MQRGCSAAFLFRLMSSTKKLPDFLAHSQYWDPQTQKTSVFGGFHAKKHPKNHLLGCPRLQFCDAAGLLSGFFVQVDELYKKAPGLFGSFAILGPPDAKNQC